MMIKICEGVFVSQAMVGSVTCEPCGLNWSVVLTTITNRRYVLVSFPCDFSEPESSAKAQVGAEKFAGHYVKMCLTQPVKE